MNSSSMLQNHTQDLEHGIPREYVLHTHQDPVPLTKTNPSTSPETTNNDPPPPATSNDDAWDASHPCFPHPNPHVPLSSPLYTSTRIIRVPRDWTVVGDLAPTFSNTYPEIIQEWVSEADFRLLVNGVNDRLIQAFNPFGWRAWLDIVMGIVTGWLWDDFGMTGIKRGCRDVEIFIEEWNAKLQNVTLTTAMARSEKDQAGDADGDLVRCIPLRRTGYLSLDLQIPDPRAHRVDDDDGDDEKTLGAVRKD